MCFLILHKLVLVRICAPKIIFSVNLQVLQNYLQASGNVLDAAIGAYKGYLAERSTESASAMNHVPSDNEEGDSILSESDGMRPCLISQHTFMQPNLFNHLKSATVNINLTASMAISVDLIVETIPTNCSGWAELIVKEMSSASKYSTCWKNLLPGVAQMKREK